LTDIFVDLNRGTVKQDITAIPNKLLEGAEEAILQVADLMKGLWQIHIRVDTGSARDSIRVERGGLGMHWREVRVRGGGYVVNPKTGRLVDYMAIIELKYGAGRQAWNEVQPEAQDIIRRICLEHIKELTSVTV
jgi:hypothetical protein